MAVVRRQVLGDVVTGYQVTPNRADVHQKPAEPDDETVRYLFERLMDESKKLARAIKPETESR
jgi:hypothetical protein